VALLLVLISTRAVVLDGYANRMIAVRFVADSSTWVLP